jgi:hypothetical protein
MEHVGIVDETGKPLRTETIPVDRMVIDPAR